MSAAFSSNSITFFESVKKFGISKPNRFEVNINSPGATSGVADDSITLVPISRTSWKNN